MDSKEAMHVAAEFTKQGRKVYRQRVMFIRDDAQEMIGAIFIPGDPLRKQSGTIVMLGADIDQKVNDVKIGDRILFTRYLPPEIELSRLDGTSVAVSVVHLDDLYVGWEDPELRKEYEDVCKTLGVDAR